MNKHQPLLCRGHSRPVPDVSHSDVTEDGFFIISACLDGKPMLRNGVTGDWIGTWAGHKGAVWSARLNHNATMAVTGSSESCKVWSAVNGAELRSFPHARSVKTAQFSPDAKRIFTGGVEKILRLFDLEHSDVAVSELTGHTDEIKSAIWQENGNIILSGSHDRSLRVWDVRTRSIVRTHEFKNPIKSLSLSQSQQFLQLTTGNSAVFLHPTSLEIICEISLPVTASSIALHPNDKKFVVGGNDLSVFVFDFDGNQLECLRGHHGPVHAVSYAPDGETFISGSEDGTIRIWQNEPGTIYGLWQKKVSSAINSNHHDNNINSTINNNINNNSNNNSCSSSATTTEDRIDKVSEEVIS